MPELKYHFETLGTHDSLIVQQAIEKRITDMTSDLKGTDKAIKAVGNYGDVWDRNVGIKTPLRLERGRNALVANGGLMLSIPVR